MAVKASAQITLSCMIDVKATYRYYLLQSATLSTPSKPTTYPPSSTWDDTEPSYTEGSTNRLYFVDCTVFTNDKFDYSEVSLSSSYEAAKAAYNKAVNAQSTADAAQDGANTAQNAAETAQSNVSALEEIISGKEDDETDDGLIGELAGLSEDLSGLHGNLYGTDDTDGDINDLKETTNNLSDSTKELQTAQEETNKKLDEAVGDLKIYKGCVVIDKDEDGTPYITVGADSETNTYVKIVPDKMQFVSNGNEAASLSDDKLIANSSEVTNLYMRSVDKNGNTVGTLGWVARSNGHLSLKVIG